MLKPKRLNIKNHHRETQLFKKRLIIITALFSLLALLLISRLVDLQLVDYTHYATESKNNLINTTPIPPTRGLIYDRNGVLLAKNIPVYTLEIVPDKIKHLKKTLTKLRHLLHLPANSIQAIENNIHHYRPFAEIPLAYNLSAKTLAIFYVNRYRFPGVMVDVQLIRHYPLGKVMADVVGYVGRITQKNLNHVNKENYAGTQFFGKRGIEAYDEKILHGTVGVAKVEINANGKVIKVIHRTPPISGSNIYLTIDSKLQAVAEKAMGTDAGSVVAIQPSTGQILAMTSNPSFNPNDFVQGISQQNYNKLLYAPNHPLYNRAVNGVYAPGSTVKPFYSAAALSDGTITPTYKIFDPGYYIIPGTQHIFHNWKRTGNGWVNVVKAIYVSCDTFFYKLAMKFGINKIDKILASFGFGQATGIDFPNESHGNLPTPAWKKLVKGKPWYTGDTVNLGIGQGYMLVTPLQLAHATTIIANRGIAYTPYLLLKTHLSNGVNISVKPRIDIHTDISPAAWRVAIKGMANVITNPFGTGFHFGRHPGYSVAAKTGTAQVYGDYRDEDHVQLSLPKHLRDNHLFIAFAPIKHPLIAVAVVAEHDDEASTVARKVIDYYLKTEGHLDAQ